MESRSHPDAARPPRAAGFATREGYLSPVFLVLMLVTSALRLPEPFDMMLGVLFWTCALLFAISGIRRGRFGARVAAALVLTFLVWQIALTAVLLHH